MAGPRMAVLGPRCRRATVAGVLSPLKVPVTVSAVPFSVAVSVPEPAIDDCIGMSIGTGDSRARYCVGCAPEDAVNATSARAVTTARVMSRNDAIELP
jgi:hypothetical protein